MIMLDSKKGRHLPDKRVGGAQFPEAKSGCQPSLVIGPVRGEPPGAAASATPELTRQAGDPASWSWGGPAPQRERCEAHQAGDVQKKVNRSPSPG